MIAAAPTLAGEHADSAMAATTASATTATAERGRTEPRRTSWTMERRRMSDTTGSPSRTDRSAPGGWPADRHGARNARSYAAAPDTAGPGLGQATAQPGRGLSRC